MKTLLVQKYGGSSLATPQQILDVAKRVSRLHQSGHSLIIVVSAMGKTTDQLVELAYQISPAPNRRELDMLLTTGERVSMALMSMALNDCKVPAISFTGSQAGVMTDESHSSARIVDIRPTRVDAELARGNVAVLAGFQGVSPKTKEVTTLGRGGSDTTAVAMAAHFKAKRCEILKDVDGVYSADPRIIPEAAHIPHLHYTQLLDMTYWGAKVLHYRSVELGYLLKIPIWIALAHPPASDSGSSGSNGSNGSNTIVDQEGPMFEQAAILSVNSHNNVRWVGVAHATVNEALQEFFRILRANNLPAPQILDSEKAAKGWRLLITAPLETLNAIRHHAGKSPSISFENDEYSSATATCQGSFASSLPEEIAKALTAQNIKIHKMLFSSMSLTVLVDEKDREKAAKLLHGLRPVSS